MGQPYLSDLKVLWKVHTILIYLTKRYVHDILFMYIVQGGSLNVEI